MTDLASRAGEFLLGGDLPVRRMGFGAMRLCGRGAWGPPADPAAAHAVLRAALALGVNFIDTADAYGPAISESMIADALHPYPAGLVIATKGGSLRPGPGRWQADGRPKHLRLALQGSLKRLRLDRIDLYQWHRPDPAVPFEESVGALADFRREGLVRHVGLSNVTVRQLEAARRIVPIASVQNAYNVTDRGSEDVLRACERAGVAFIPYYPLGVGRLAAAGGALRDVASRWGATPTQVALAWLLDRSPVMLPIPGTSSLAHLEENVGAAGFHLSKEDRQRLDER